MAPTRVVHLATSLYGGAGIAARRTHEALLSIGVDSHLFSLTGVRTEYKSVETLKRRKLHRFKSSVTTIFQSKFVQNSRRLVTPISLGNFSLDLLLKEHFDVIHIHSFYNLLSIQQIKKFANTFPDKRVFVTLHDERVLTGGCHYTGSCKENQTDCTHCPQVQPWFRGLVHKQFIQSTVALNGLENVTLIAPSFWIRKKAQLSRVTFDLRSVVIRNPLPDCFFEKSDFNTSSIKKQICFISANLNNELKGLDALIHSLNTIRKNYPQLEFKVCFVGTGTVIGLHNEIEFEIISTHSDSQTAEVLRMSDLLVVPSIEDNLPSTMLEALAVGIPVVGARVGGITEVLEQANQRLFEAGKLDELTTAILDSLFEPRPVNKEAIAREFGYSAVAEVLLREYSAAN
jgi:glycosyltransferase involved in cell wall biosynthesis